MHTTTTAYTVVAVATIYLAHPSDHWRPPDKLQQLIESELSNTLLDICGQSVKIEHVIVEPAPEDAHHNLSSASNDRDYCVSLL